MAWKRKVENHFISVAPVLQDILEWAEDAGNEVITREHFVTAASSKLGRERVIVLNAAIWGFISAGVSAPAETMFMGADRLNGLDGWRRLRNYISHGKKVHLETLRRDMKLVVERPISSMDKLEEGLAEFENAIKLYEDAGGDKYNGETNKIWTS